MKDNLISFHQTMKGSDSQKWIDTIKEEFKSMQENQVWDLVPLPEGKRPIGCKWLFKTKKDSMGKCGKDIRPDLLKKALLKRKALVSPRLSPVSLKDSFRTIMAPVAHI